MIAIEPLNVEYTKGRKCIVRLNIHSRPYDFICRYLKGEGVLIPVMNYLFILSK